MDRGICKITGGWGSQDSAWVRYSDNSRLEVPRDQYRFAGYEPPFDSLPECKGEQHANWPKQTLAEGTDSVEELLLPKTNILSRPNSQSLPGINRVSVVGLSPVNRFTMEFAAEFWYTI